MNEQKQFCNAKVFSNHSAGSQFLVSKFGSLLLLGSDEFMHFIFQINLFLVSSIR